MPRAQKGQRFGGRVKGTPNKKTVEKALEAERAVAEAKASGRKLGKEMLDDFMHTFAGMAAVYQPLPPGVEAVPQGRAPNEEKFERYARLTIDAAKELAKYQSPQFRAIAIAPPPPVPIGDGTMRKRFTLTIFEHGAAPKLIDARREDDNAA